jgi:ribosomal protein L37AE/L43A
MRRLPPLGGMSEARSVIRMDRRSDRHDRRPDQRVRPRQGGWAGRLGDLPQSQRRERLDRAGQRKEGDNRTRCEHCDGLLRARGALGSAGHLRWKCRKCGRTVITRPDFKPPVPIVPTGRIGAMGG